MKFQKFNYTIKVALVSIFLKTHLSLDIRDFIKDCIWKEDIKLCQNIVSNTLTSENIKYLNNKLGANVLEHKMDKRNPCEYALDLITNWIIEDAILTIINDEFQLECELSGADKNREFLFKPTTAPDFKLLTNNKKEQYIELMNDFTGYWKKMMKIEFRDNKYLYLKKEKVILLGVDFINKNFLIINFTKLEDSRVEYIKSYKPYGCKPAHKLSLRDSNFYDNNGVKKFLTSL